MVVAGGDTGRSREGGVGGRGVARGEELVACKREELGNVPGIHPPGSRRCDPQSLALGGGTIEGSATGAGGRGAEGGEFWGSCTWGKAKSE